MPLLLSPQPPITCLHASKGVVDIHTRSADTTRSSPNGWLWLAITPLIHTQNLQPNVDTHTHIRMIPAAANRRRGLQSLLFKYSKKAHACEWSQPSFTQGVTAITPVG